MKKCEITYECPFFNDLMPGLHSAKQREAIKRKYCGGGNTQCARFIVAQALGQDEVPQNLLPHDFYKINVILGI